MSGLVYQRKVYMGNGGNTIRLQPLTNIFSSAVTIAVCNQYTCTHFGYDHFVSPCVNSSTLYCEDHSIWIVF